MTLTEQMQRAAEAWARDARVYPEDETMPELDDTEDQMRITHDDDGSGRYLIVKIGRAVDIVEPGATLELPVFPDDDFSATFHWSGWFWRPFQCHRCSRYRLTAKCRGCDFRLCRDCADKEREP